MGVFLVKMKNAFVPIERVNSMNTYSRISQSHKGVSKVSERAHECSERSEAECCVESEWTERCERASDQVACKNRDCL